MSAIDNESTHALPIEATMTAILATMTAILYGLHAIQVPLKSKKTPTSSSFLLQLSSALPIQLPNPQTEPTKYCYEIFCTKYTIFWISSFSCIVVSQCYEYFTAWTYLFVCGGLALPLVLQPWLYPSAGFDKHQNADVVDVVVNPDIDRPLFQRHSTKCVVYLLTYSFIGNYWYTHYFYSVLQAQYSMPAHRLNDVPIAMYLATHFYFTTYHVCVGNGFLRFVDQYYEDREDDGASDGSGNDGNNHRLGSKTRGWRKRLLFWYTVLYLSYFTAFMETLTISSFPYYSFEDRVMAYKYGSAFYGIYFLVSFPGFYHLDCFVDDDFEDLGKGESGKRTQLHGSRAMSLMDTFVTSCGHGMMILTLLDFVRLYIGIPLTIGGVAFATTDAN
ncbi:hypothetical protein ACHAXS_010239 [Conticribra weissflogii]